MTGAHGGQQILASNIAHQRRAAHRQTGCRAPAPALFADDARVEVEATWHLPADDRGVLSMSIAAVAAS